MSDHPLCHVSISLLSMAGRAQRLFSVGSQWKIPPTLVLLFMIVLSFPIKRSKSFRATSCKRFSCARNGAIFLSSDFGPPARKFTQQGPRKKIICPPLAAGKLKNLPPPPHKILNLAGQGYEKLCFATHLVDLPYDHVVPV